MYTDKKNFDFNHKKRRFKHKNAWFSTYHKNCKYNHKNIIPWLKMFPHIHLNTEILYQLQSSKVAKVEFSPKIGEMKKTNAVWKSYTVFKLCSHYNVSFLIFHVCLSFVKAAACRWNIVKTVVELRAIFLIEV